MSNYRVRTYDHGVIGGFTAKISIDGGQIWHKVPPRYVGGGLVSFDNKAQALKFAAKMAQRMLFPYHPRTAPK